MGIHCDKHLRLACSAMSVSQIEFRSSMAAFVALIRYSLCCECSDGWNFSVSVLVLLLAVVYELVASDALFRLLESLLR